MHEQQMISTRPHVRGNTNDALIRCIEECFDCAGVCTATGVVASRRTGSNEEVIRQMLAACETACRLCGEECERHAPMHEHCRVCTETAWSMSRH